MAATSSPWSPRSGWTTGPGTRFACRLNKGIFAAVVDGVSANANASILGAVNPVERFSTSVSIGKKPGSTDPSDSFSGWIDQLNISAG